MSLVFRSTVTMNGNIVGVPQYVGGGANRGDEGGAMRAWQVLHAVIGCRDIDLAPGKNQ